MNTAETLHNLAVWIANRCGIHPNRDVIPVRVQIADESWEGVRYLVTFIYSATMDACTRGGHQPGDTYSEDMCYLLGQYPKVNRRPSRRPGHVCYQHANGLDWYLACWITDELITPPNAPYHPFGPSFMIKPWEHKSRIDEYEFKRPKPRMPWSRPVHDPYIRYPLTITNL